MFQDIFCAWITYCAAIAEAPCPGRRSRMKAWRQAEKQAEKQTEKQTERQASISQMGFSVAKPATRSCSK